jgi:hypothetical protein
MTYYQPENNEEIWEEEGFYSFMVNLSKKQARTDFPTLKILTYKDDDIEDPTFVDHECSWDTVKWETVASAEIPKFQIPHYYIAGQGGMLYRDGLCRECGRKLTEKYLRVGVFFKYSDEEAF